MQNTILPSISIPPSPTVTTRTPYGSSPEKDFSPDFASCARASCWYQMPVEAPSSLNFLPHGKLLSPLLFFVVDFLHHCAGCFSFLFGKVSLSFSCRPLSGPGSPIPTASRFEETSLKSLRCFFFFFSLRKIRSLPPLCETGRRFPPTPLG